ncbi:MAG: hypothetical protein K2M44_03105 [Clostridia bacterium]|nr:hypothetical protein [Clostridia bacterium]
MSENQIKGYVIVGDNCKMLPALGDWLSAIISLAMFGFSWLCNHWVKQGVLCRSQRSAYHATVRRVRQSVSRNWSDKLRN